MAYSRLRVYYGPDDQDTATSTAETTARSCVTVPLGDVLPQLAEAIASDRAWVHDFADDEITLSADLYEVLMAYRYYRPVA